MPEIAMEIAAVRRNLGDGLFFAMIQLQVAVNRLTTSLALHLLNAQEVEPKSESGSSRNRAALSAWVGLELQEMTRAIDLLGGNNVDQHLTWSQPSMKALRDVRDRWRSKRYKQLRVKMGAHVKPSVLQRGADLLQRNRGDITAISMSGPEGHHQHFAGADEILLEGVFGPSDDQSALTRAMATMRQVRDDSVVVHRAATDVVLDLLGADKEEVRERPQANGCAPDHSD